MNSPDRLRAQDEDDDEYDDMAPATAAPQQQQQQLPTVATPEDDAGEVAAAAAEVSVMERGGRANRRDPTGDEALIGATGNADGVGAFEVVDESGELVKARFLEFLVN